jgi:hypothetical protein
MKTAALLLSVLAGPSSLVTAQGPHYPGDPFFVTSYGGNFTVKKVDLQTTDGHAHFTQRGLVSLSIEGIVNKQLVRAAAAVVVVVFVLAVPLSSLIFRLPLCSLLLLLSLPLCSLSLSLSLSLYYSLLLFISSLPTPSSIITHTRRTATLRTKCTSRESSAKLTAVPLRTSSAPTKAVILRNQCT